MKIEKEIFQLIDDFIKRCDKTLFNKNFSVINSMEIYYKSHTFLDILKVMDINENTIRLMDKLTCIIQTVLELDK